MAWFKIDDELPDNRKTRAVRKTHQNKARDVAPFGIWALAGAWSDDGFVPLEVLEDWDDDAETLATRLVKAGFWHRVKRDGEPGFVFHDWHVHNPAKAENDPSVTGTFGNHVRWHVQRQLVDPDCVHCPTEPDDLSADIAPDSGSDSHPTSQTPLPESLPSRPDPTRARPEPEETTRASALVETDHFDEFWDTYAHKVGRKKAETAYKAALKKPGVTTDLLIASAAAYIDSQMADRKHPQFTKHPATWLTGEHWRDERVARPPARTRFQEHIALVQQLGEAAPTISQIGPAR